MQVKLEKIVSNRSYIEALGFAVWAISTIAFGLFCIYIHNEYFRESVDPLIVITLPIIVGIITAMWMLSRHERLLRKDDSRIT